MKTAMPTVRALHKQVYRAMPKGKSERSVETVITQGMWDMFCTEAGIPLGTKPHDFVSVWGSKTRVVDKPGLWSASRACSEWHESFSV